MTIPNPYNLPEVEVVMAQNAAGTITVGANAAGQLFAQGINGNPAFAAPVIAAGAGAGSSPTLGAQTGHDLGGSQLLTLGSTPAAGALVTVTFGTALAAAPAAVVVTGWDTTSGVGVAVGATSISKTGFTISGPAGTAAHVLLLTYVVIAS